MISSIPSATTCPPRMQPKMNVAIAGVSNGLGHWIALALLSNPRFSVTLLTRTKSNDALESLITKGAILKVVDYGSSTSLAGALSGIHTVISTVWIHNNIVPMRSLLQAAVAAGVKRFAPSEFSFSAAANVDLIPYHVKVELWKEVQKSGLEYTAFRNGLFMDYMAAGSSVPYPGLLTLHPYILDVKARRAEIPGTGDERMSFTTQEDVGRFVAAAVALDKWPEEMGMEGETTTWNRIVEEAEKVVGERFTVSYVSREQLKERLKDIPEDNWMGRFVTAGNLAIIDGKAAVIPYLNEATDVKPTNVSTFLNKYWGS
ncbi:hypothetical protein BDQ12DRAFT_337155 [Crucibulum laeve]|uniref:NmrA-like domain-containing protein n=1 Tax=Crucibulum laeve TaxID=68775 RepID=A0A5C3LPL1_9AGAR|nr:hypothetical protein BDQ12DRAFT_337155 [Crucibulum laeve]